MSAFRGLPSSQPCLLWRPCTQPVVDHRDGPARVGLVTKRVSRRHNTTDTPIAFGGEAGYQANS